MASTRLDLHTHISILPQMLHLSEELGFTDIRQEELGGGMYRLTAPARRKRSKEAR